MTETVRGRPYAIAMIEVLPDDYTRPMGEVPSGELRDNTADVLRRVQDGERVTITVDGRPVAELVPLQRVERRPIPLAELAELLERHQADPGLREDLEVLAGDTTDDLGPIR